MCWQIACHKRPICHPFPRLLLFIYVRGEREAAAGAGNREICRGRDLGSGSGKWDVKILKASTVLSTSNMNYLLSVLSDTLR